jgi:flagellin-specific chaperone FliS
LLKNPKLIYENAKKAIFDIAEQINLQKELKEAFDSGSYSVPTFFMYNCKENSTEPYELLHIYKVTYSDGLQLDILNKENILKTYNIITELSLNFDSDLIVKKYYELQDIYHARILESETQSNKFEDEREHVISTFNTFESYVDEYLSYYKKIVLDILDIKRAEDRNMWRDTIFAIANIINLYQ